MPTVTLVQELGLTQFFAVQLRERYLQMHFAGALLVDPRLDYRLDRHIVPIQAAARFFLRQHNVEHFYNIALEANESFGVTKLE